jgi:hypothetical protein
MTRWAFQDFAPTASETPRKNQEEKGDKSGATFILRLSLILILRLLSLFMLASNPNLRRSLQITRLGNVVADSVSAIVGHRRHSKVHQGCGNQGGTAQLHGIFPMLFLTMAAQ